MTTTAMSQALEALDVEQFWERGYAILRGVYTPEEIAAFRTAAYASRGFGGDLLANPRLRSAVTDGRMVEVAKKLLGTDDLFYSGDSSFTVNGTQRGWHKDNTDRVDPKAPDWDSRYTQLRFGIYCQDHSEHTGGLNLRVGSHDIPNTTDGENLYVKTKPGDLAVWSMRITHSGNGMLLKDPEAAYPLPNEHEKHSPDEVAQADGDRIAIFVHIGANDSHANRYADYTKTRKYLVDAWRMRPYDDEALKAAADAGLHVRDLPAEVKDDPNAGLNELWQPFPYPGWTPPKTAPAPKPAAAAAPAAPAAGTAKPGASATATATVLAKRVVRTAKGAARGAVNAWKSSAR